MDTRWQYDLWWVGRGATRMINKKLEATKSKFLTLKAAGFTNREIIEAYKAGQLALLLALAEDAD